MRRGWVRAAAGAAVLAPALLVALAPATAAPAASGPAALPDRMAGYSHLTGDVSSAPPGRAVALFQFGFGVEFLDFPQAVVVGADGDVYRRLDVAEDRAGSETQGDPAPMLLSPGGTAVAVGDHDSAASDLAVVDLATGRTDLHPVPAVRSLLPLAWSADGGRLAYLGSPEPSNPHSGTLLTGDVGVLDLGTGRARRLTEGAAVTTAAFSPDGTELAVQHSGGTLEVVDLAGRPVRTLRPGSGFVLDGPSAWSPDGTLLAVRPGAGGCVEPGGDTPRRCTAPGVAVDDVIAFVDATGRGAPTPGALDRDVSDRRLLGWTAPRRVAVLVPDPAGDAAPDVHRVLEVPLDGDVPRRLSALPTSGGNYGVGEFQLATALLADLEVRAAGEPDRGRWPLALRLGAALAAGAAATGVARLLGRRRGPAAG